MKAALTILFLCISFLTNAQLTTINGIINDETGIPLPGVNVFVKETNDGTQTDFDGNFSIQLEEGHTLVFSYVGFVTQEYTVTKTETITITLMDDTSTLDEVVVTGYAIKKEKKALGFAVTSVKSESIAQRSRRENRKLNRLLKGKAAGVNIVNASGLSGSNTHVVIRGATSNQTPEAESYKEIEENTFKLVNAAPLSTFSIDVDKAGYSNIRRMINNGQKIPQDAVKIEEMINYFSYNYPEPKANEPFSITTEITNSPWNNDTKLLRVGLKGKDISTEKLPNSNLVFLLDVSGSMNSENKLPLLKSALAVLVDKLREQDKVSIVVYAGAAGLVLAPTSGVEKDKILKAIDQLSAGGSTAGGAGIKLAYKIAEENFIEGGNNRVILATDGDFNVGASSDHSMKDLIEEKRKSGVFLTCLGFGMGNYRDSKMETLADKGNGNHAYIDTMQEAQKVLGEEFFGTLYTIAKDVKLQVEFNPKNVQAYRLIGYENRLLNDEDFKDDKKDAGELGSGHTVTAIYEVIPAGVKSKYIDNQPTLKYTNDKQIKKGFSNEIATIKFRYKEPSGSKSKLIV